MSVHVRILRFFIFCVKQDRMKLINSLIILLILIISCDRDANDQEVFEECFIHHPQSVPFAFWLLDSITNVNLLIGNSNSLIKILKEDMSEVDRFKKSSGRVEFVIPEYFEQVGDSIIDKKFFIHLNRTPSNLDIDTLRFKYTLGFYEKNCPNIWYDFIEIYFNEKLYHSGDYLNSFTFYK